MSVVDLARRLRDEHYPSVFALMLDEVCAPPDCKAIAVAVGADPLAADNYLVVFDCPAQTALAELAHRWPGEPELVVTMMTRLALVADGEPVGVTDTNSTAALMVVHVTADAVEHAYVALTPTSEPMEVSGTAELDARFQALLIPAS